VDCADTGVKVEQIAKQFDDTAKGAMADQNQRKDQLKQPSFRDGEMEKDIIVIGVRLRECIR